jgi:UDP-2,3-diacylglucosamine hydrolase
MSCCFISDVHLSATNDNSVFLNWLANLNAEVEQLYILGDFFDAWSNTELEAAWCIEIINALFKASQQRQIFIMLGNHDFLLDSQFAKLANVTIIVTDVFLLQWKGKNILLTHGDTLVANDLSYLIFRRVIRTRLVRFLYSILSKKHKLRLINLIKSGSDTKGRYVDICHDKARKIIAGHDQAIDYLICGHFHRSQKFEVAKVLGVAKVVVLGAWVGDNLNNGRFFCLNQENYI